MGSCIVCGTSVDGNVCDLHEGDTVFEFRGQTPEQLTQGRYYQGSVDAFAEFGVFINIGDEVTGFLRQSELDIRLENLDWQSGEEVYVKVSNIRDNGNVELGWSIRQAEEEFRGVLIDDPTVNHELLPSENEKDEDVDEITPLDSLINSSPESESVPSATAGLKNSPNHNCNGFGWRDTDKSPTTVPTAPRGSLSYDDIEKGELIGRGGYAAVYRGQATVDGERHDVALKHPPRPTGKTIDSNEIVEEGQTWQALDDHDHIVSVIDYGPIPGPWIAMEYMDGGHLGERADRMEDDQALWTALAITDAVFHAHRHSVIHRDLKPANVLFRSVENGWDVPKVADWGLSKRLLEDSKSRDGYTLKYASPEHFKEDEPTSQASDIYQLGAICYELFTGQPPFDGDPYVLMEKIKDEQPTPPSEIADVPAGLDDIVLQALAKDKDDRYEDAVYLRDDLQALVE